MITQRFLTDSDWPAFVAFLEQYVPPSHIRDHSFNEHWFKRTSAEEWSIRVLEDPIGRVRGVFSLIVNPLWFSGRVTEIAWISTGYVDKDMIAAGGGAQLFFWTYRNFPFVGALCCNHYSLPINHLLGQEIPNTQLRRFLFIHSKDTLQLCQKEDQDLALLDHFYLPQKPMSLTCNEVGSPSADFDPFWQRVRNELVLTTDRSRAFLEWRYRDVPLIKYEMCEIRQADRLVAFAVLRFQTTPAGVVCRIMDFVSDNHIAADAWKTVLWSAQSKGALFSDFHVIGTWQDEALLNSGFRLVNHKSGLEVVPNLLSPVAYRHWTNTVHIGGTLAKKDQSWRTAEAVYFTKGDSDRDWPTPYDKENLMDV